MVDELGQVLLYHRVSLLSLRLRERPCVEKHHLNQPFHLHSSSANRRVSNSNLRVPLALHQEGGPPQVPLLGCGGKLLHVREYKMMMRREDIIIITAP